MAKRKRTDNTMTKRKRTDNTMAKRKSTKGQTLIYKTLHIHCCKTKDLVTQIQLKTGDALYNPFGKLFFKQ
jgi:hypothetical protein